MAYRGVILSALIWGIVWGIGGWLFGKYETGKEFSWLIGMPLYLPTSMAIWGTLQGAVVMQEKGAIRGAFLGTGIGVMLGVLGFFVLMGVGSETEGLVFKPVPSWLTVDVIWAIGGVLAGILTGAISGLIVKVTTTPSGLL